MVLGQLGIHTCKKDVRPLHPVISKKKSQKWIREFNIDAKIIELLEENIVIHSHDLKLGNNFLYVTQKA